MAELEAAATGAGGGAAANGVGGLNGGDAFDETPLADANGGAWGLSMPGGAAASVVTGLSKAQVKGKLSQLRRTEKQLLNGEPMPGEGGVSERSEGIVGRVVTSLVERVERADRVEGMARDAASRRWERQQSRLRADYARAAADEVRVVLDGIINQVRPPAGRLPAGRACCPSPAALPRCPSPTVLLLPMPARAPCGSSSCRRKCAPSRGLVAAWPV